MESLRSLIDRRLVAGDLVSGADSETLRRHLKAQTARGDDLIVSHDPLESAAAFLQAGREGRSIALGDPNWTPEQQASAREILTRERMALSNESALRQEGPFVYLPSGGTGGGIKFARHTATTLATAARGFAAHFRSPQVSSLGVLPFYHVSGLMPWVRALVTGGSVRLARWKELESGIWPAPRNAEFLSLVPTQVRRLLDLSGGGEWLRSFRAVLVGGGPAWGPLLEAGAAARVPLAPCYGMTETAAMVAALRPDEFLAGERSCGRPLPHASLRLRPAGEEGEYLEIETASLFLGYAGEARRAPGPWLTEDLGRRDERGGIHVLGRRDDVIITGGKKVAIHEVESALRQAGFNAEFAIIGLEDTDWGQSVTVCFPSAISSETLSVLAANAAKRLASHARPKRWLALPEWPRNAQGKLDRRRLLELARATVREPNG